MYIENAAFDNFAAPEETNKKTYVCLKKFVSLCALFTLYTLLKPETCFRSFGFDVNSFTMKGMTFLLFLLLISVYQMKCVACSIVLAFTVLQVNGKEHERLLQDRPRVRPESLNPPPTSGPTPLDAPENLGPVALFLADARRAGLITEETYRNFIIDYLLSTGQLVVVEPIAPEEPEEPIVSETIVP